MKIERYGMKMKYLHPRTRLQQQQQRCVELEQKLRLKMDEKLTRSKQKLAIYIERMKGLSPLAKLNQGFSYVASKEGKAVKSIQDVDIEDSLTIYVTDGLVKAKVQETIKEDHGER
jgi:exodeoxyribonuclease VII large subunit